jgi:hypothetical protein
VNLQSLADDVAHPHTRVERSIGVLKNDLHLASHIAQLALGELQQIPALKDHLAAGRFDESKNRSAQSRFAAARLADQAQSLALVDGQTDVIDRFDHGFAAREKSLADGEVLFQVANF